MIFPRIAPSFPDAVLPPSPSLRPALRRALVVAALLSAPLMYNACLDFSSAPEELMYLTFEELPFPAVVAGDTLRDTTGAVALLAAQAVNAGGNVISGAPVRFYSVGDTADVLEVDSATGRVVSGVAGPQLVRLIASVSGLQSPPLLLAVTKRPDSLAVEVPSDTISYSFTDTTLNFSAPLTVKLLHNDSTTFYSGVQSWVVRYTLERATDTVYASIVNDQNRRLASQPDGLFHIDTTAGDGGAARKLRIRPGPPLSPVIDSVAIIVEARHRGAPVAGSPARIVVYIRPRIG